MGPARRPVLHERQDLGGIDGHAELGEALRHPVDPLPALLALLAQEALKPGGLPVHGVAEDVDLGGPAVPAARHVAVDLEPGDDLQRWMVRRLVDRLGERVGRVVVGDREHAHPVLDREAHELAWSQRAVRRGRVRVEVDRAAHASPRGR